MVFQSKLSDVCETENLNGKFTTTLLMKTNGGRHFKVCTKTENVLLMTSYELIFIQTLLYLKSILQDTGPGELPVSGFSIFTIFLFLIMC